MDYSNCSQPNYRAEDHLVLLFERVVPYLVHGLLFGGIAPYLVHVSDEIFNGGIQGHSQEPYKTVSITCKEWHNINFVYPSHVTDVILFYQCEEGHTNTLIKVNNTLAKNPSPLARPNVIIIFEKSLNKLLLKDLQHTPCIGTVITFNNFQFDPNGDINMDVQYYRDGVLNTTEPRSLPHIQHFDGFSEGNNSTLDFRGKLFHVTTSQWSPFVEATAVLNGTNIYEGYAISVLQLLAEKHNFRYDFEEENLYGSKSPNGTWLGMVGHVHRQHKDLAVAALTINANRMTVVDFTNPFWFEPTAAIINIQESQEFYLFLPFTTTVWLMIFGVFATSTFCYCGLNYLASKTSRKEGKDRLYASNVAAWYFAQLWLSQSGTGRPIKSPLRAVSAVMSFSLIVLCATYSGNLIAAFTVHKPNIPLKSLDELSRSTEFYPFIQLGTVHHSLYQESTSGIYARLWKRIESNMPESLCKGDYSYCTEVWTKSKHLVKIGDKSGLLSVDKVASGCKAQLIPEEFFPSGYGIAMPKGSPYKPMFNEVINMMMEMGLLQFFGQKHKVSDDCTHMVKERTNAHTLSIYEVAALFVVLMAGVGSSTMVLTMEILFKRLRPMWLKSRRKSGMVK